MPHLHQHRPQHHQIEFTRPGAQIAAQPLHRHRPQAQPVDAAPQQRHTSGQGPGLRLHQGEGDLAAVAAAAQAEHRPQTAATHPGAQIEHPQRRPAQRRKRQIAQGRLDLAGVARQKEGHPAGLPRRRPAHRKGRGVVGRRQLGNTLGQGDRIGGEPLFSEGRQQEVGQFRVQGGQDRAGASSHLEG